ncbi:hypothetical protein C8J57DRAFT_1225756 [Mycena rebaudengoi]|nr:hypothetical protein C8J57DRAFT_1225756 [Mycena rebaudengoi]
MFISTLTVKKENAVTLGAMTMGVGSWQMTDTCHFLYTPKINVTIFPRALEELGHPRTFYLTGNGEKYLFWVVHTGTSQIATQSFNSISNTYKYIEVEPWPSYNILLYGQIQESGNCHGKCRSSAMNSRPRSLPPVSSGEILTRQQVIPPENKDVVSQKKKEEEEYTISFPAVVILLPILASQSGSKKQLGDSRESTPVFLL